MAANSLRLPASAVAPKCLEVGWFSQRDLSRIALWDPGLFGIAAPQVNHAD
jgi:hypothetical protein